MGPAARVLAALAPLLLLLLGAPLARGDCGEPPEVQHTQPPDLSGQKSFSVGKSVTYKCAPGLVKMPGLPDSVVCQQDGQWSELAVFCNRSCDVPPRLLFAFLRIRYSKQNYFPAGSTVHYSCREGYTKVMSDKLTCLPEFVWSKPNEFCKKKPCPNPGEIKNGHINITTDMLFGATILFSCDTGYKLVGAASSYCTVMGNNVGWSSTPPECKEISCSAPPEVHNGTIQEPQPLYVYRQSVTYKCAEGFTLAGDKSIYCTVKDGEGAWSGPPPECRAAQTAATTRATTRAHATSATKRRGPPPSGAGTTVFGKFGSPAVRRHCQHCEMSDPFSWRRILSFRCLRSTVKMQCLRVPWRRPVNTVYQRVLWTPLRSCYVPKNSQPCSCSKVVLGQLQIVWPISHVLLRASCCHA
ncbi:complement decay-accelerating factor isoform X6 [Erinaceus europaeus]|uniref:Complement decay-accelerating factor isoform X6 n=1 Tax=Erinaceus europaeus TaxID=9365 RepID=A0ABM3WCP3_ERIEU|nr:complement decay-accelerating factor isoform X6 [Erinaceus europaeus]